MGKKHGVMLSTLCLALLLLITIPGAASARAYGYETERNTSTVRNPTVILGASLELDGHAVSSSSCTSPCTLSISTTLPYDVIVVLVEGNAGGVSCSLPTDTQGLSWKIRTACADTPAGSPGQMAYGAYWAVASSPLSSDTVSVTITGGGNLRLLIFAVNGANTNNPFDPNGALPSFSSANEPSGCVMSTSNPNDFLFSTAQQGATPTYVVPTGFTPIDHTTFGEESEDAFDIVTTTQSTVTTTWATNPHTGTNLVTTCDAIVGVGNIGSSSNSLNTAVSVALPSTVAGGPGASYYENANGPVPCSVTTDTSTTVPGTSGSFTFTSPQGTCLVSPSFSSATTIPGGSWLVDFWASATANSALTLSLNVETSSGIIVYTLSTGTSALSIKELELKTYLSANSVVVPAGDFLVLAMSPQTGGGGTDTIYWGTSQLTLFQQPNTYGFVLSVTNLSNTASYLVDLGFVNSSNTRINNMTIFIGAPTSRQIVIGTGIGSPTSPNTFGPQVTLSSSKTMFIGLAVSVTNVGTTLVRITLKIQLGAVLNGPAATTPYAQDTIAITVN
ncbi:MAG TPA: hypothetical protein VKF39_02420 [Nitrososphaerales archaeon]|nr:hypothetical protein [Nitrososphaerales archaeon]